MRPGRRRTLPADSPLAERERASLRAKVEHPFLFIKRRFGYDKVRYRGGCCTNPRSPRSIHACERGVLPLTRYGDWTPG